MTGACGIVGDVGRKENAEDATPLRRATSPMVRIVYSQ